MHDSLECRIGGVWAHVSLQSGSILCGPAQLLEPYWWIPHGLPDVPILTKTISFKPHGQRVSLSWLRLRHLTCCSGFQIYVDLSCCAPLFMHFIYRCVKNRESWSPTCFKSFIRNLNHCFSVYFIEKLKRVRLNSIRVELPRTEPWGLQDRIWKEVSPWLSIINKPNNKQP